MTYRRFTFSRDVVLFTLVLLLGAILRVFHLDDIPAEMWGDITLGAEFTEQILQGQWPWYFVLGNGPLFFYIASLFVKMAGMSFYAFKLTCTVLGVVLIWVGYCLGSVWGGKKMGLLTAFFLAVSRWPLVYGRAGFMNILVPISVGIVFHFLLLAMKSKRRVYWLWAAAFLGIGLYNYPVFAMIMPLTVGCTILVYLVTTPGAFKRNLSAFFLSAVIFFLISIPFLQMLIGNPSYWFASGSYFGSKLITPEGGVRKDWGKQLVENTKNSLFMFHIRGDEIFRVNVPHRPHLDIISGILLLIGIFALLRSRGMYRSIVLVPFFLLQIPQILVLNFPRETPSMTRGIALVPFVSLLVAYGCLVVSRKVPQMILYPLGIGLVLLNTIDYFLIYPKTLPNHNTPYAKLIAYQIDQLPEDRAVYHASCCWGEWSQPEPASWYFTIPLGGRQVYYQQAVATCADIAKHPAVLIFSPKDRPEKIQSFENCFDDTRLQTFQYDNQHIFSWLEIPPL